MKYALTKNIWRHEMQCKCGKCGFDTMDFETINVVQDCCDHFAELMSMPRVYCRIHSAARCADHNAKVGGSPNSQHVKSRAIDFSIRGVSPVEVYAYLDKKYPDKYGVGEYGTFTHIDTRSGAAARW